MKKRRWISLFLAMLMAVSTVLTALPSQQVLAAETEDTASEDEDVITVDSLSSSGTDLDLVDSVSHVTVHDPSIVKGYVNDSVTAMSTSVEIIGEKDDTHTKAVYFIFGSHLAWAYSWDMVNWKTFTNNINRNYSTLFANEFDWANNGDSAYAESGNMWAPDVIWNEAMGKWCMYMSINGCSWNSCICLLTADSLYGSWTYVGPVVYSGFTASGTYSYTYTDYAAVTGDTSLPSRYTTSSYTCYDGTSACTATTWNTSYGAHAIDPCVTYDADGNLWMSYGSWSGGIYIFELDETTGLRDTSVTYDTVTNVSDAYMGYKIAGGYTSSGEASYIEYINGYYYLFVTYGGLTSTGGYNMRLYRSTTINGGYVDESGDSAIDTAYVNNVVSSQGLRVMTYYKWSFQTYAQVAQGHNSIYYDEDSGKIYLVYHRRTNDGTEGHEVRVHQMFVNEDGWLVTAPFEYTGETISDTGYSTSDITGTYEMIIQYQDTDHANLGYSGSKFITLESDGTVSGSMSGTWVTTDNSPYVTMVLNGETYKGVFLEQQIEGVKSAALTFTVLGESNETYLWGYQCDDTTTATVGTKTGSTPNTLAWNYLNNFFVLSAASGDFTMEWTFTNYNQGSSSAKYQNYVLCITTSLSLNKVWANYNQSTTDWCLRADAANNDLFSGSTFTCNIDLDVDSTDFPTIMNGATVQATLTRSGTTMTYTAVITGSDGNTYNYTATVTDAPTDAIAVYLGGENCYLEIEAGSISGNDSQTAPTSHTWDAGSVTTAATCITPGEMTYTCTDAGCTETKTVMIPAIGHTYKETVVEPTCTEGGYTILTCTTCGNTIKKNYVEATGHSYTSKVVSATSQTKGYTLHTCSSCGDSYKDTYTSIPITLCSISVSGSYTYTGGAVEATIVVKDGNKTLTKGTDYTVSYSGHVNAGTASYTVKGIGDYTDSYSGTYTIAKASQTLTASVSSASVAVGSTVGITASGTGTLTYSSSNTSVATVSSSGVITGKNAGTATITVTAAGDSNYASATKTIRITVTKATQPV
ncbi:MAG: family 43 glycosylhydrolase, partial [Clostridiales bacterium]|nr:family 43 glycosylhydrolase [Clostridiales bacterium]